MPFVPPFNPQVVSPGRIRRFSGVAGLPNMVLKKADSNGRDLSDAFANDVQDFDCDTAGMMRVRGGHIKLGDGSTSSIYSLFEVRLGGRVQYGSLDGDSLSLYDIPWITNPFIPLPPFISSAPNVVPTDYPATFPVPPSNPKDQPVDNDAPATDPSVGPELQSCENSHTHSTTPTTLAFTMQKGGTLPADQYWYWRVNGWWNNDHVGTYTNYPTWARQYQVLTWPWLVKACQAEFVGYVIVKIQAAASALAAGAYTWGAGLVFTDGGTHGCTVTLTVTEPVMSVDGPAPMFCQSDGTTLVWDTLDVSNATAGNTLDWTASIVSDTSGKLALGSASGSIVGVGTDTITLSFTSTPAAGTYTAIVSVAGNGTPASINTTITFTVVPIYAGAVKSSSLWTYTVPAGTQTNVANLPRINATWWGATLAGSPQMSNLRFFASASDFNTAGWNSWGTWTIPSFYGLTNDDGGDVNGVVAIPITLSFNATTGCPTGTARFNGASGPANPGRVDATFGPP